MRRILFAALFACCIVIQLVATIQGNFWLANFSLCALVVCTVFLSLENCLVFALIGGAILDSYSGGVFGFNITFLLFVCLFSKLVLNLGDKNRSITSVLSLILLMEVLYIFLSYTIIFSAEYISQLNVIVSHMLWQLGSTLVVSLILFWMAERISLVKVRLPSTVGKKRLWR